MSSISTAKQSIDFLRLQCLKLCAPDFWIKPRIPSLYEYIVALSFARGEMIHDIQIITVEILIERLTYIHLRSNLKSRVRAFREAIRFVIVTFCIFYICIIKLLVTIDGNRNSQGQFTKYPRKGADNWCRKLQ